MKVYTNCEEVRAEFSALLDDELSTAESEAVEAHLAECSDCLRELDGLKQVDVLYRALPDVNAPDDFEDSLRDVLRPRLFRFPKFATFRNVGGTLAAAAVLLIFAGSFWGIRYTNDPEFSIARQDDMKSRAVSTKNDEMPVAESLAEPESASGGTTVEGLFDEAPKKEAQFGSADFAAASETRAILEEAESEPPVLQDSRSVLDVVDDAPREGARYDRDEIRASRTPSAVRGRVETGEVEGEAVAVAKTVSRLQEPPLPQLEQAAGERVESLRRAKAAASTAPAAPSARALTGLSQSFADTTQKALPSDAKPRVFEKRDDIWYEQGYDDEPVKKLTRNSDVLKTLVQKDAHIEEFLTWPEAVVFLVDAQWYELPPLEP